MLNEIENAIVTLLTDKLESARKIGVQKGVWSLSQPAVFASAEAGAFERMGQAKVKHSVTVYLDILFKHLKGPKERREGVNLILEGALQLLLLNDLGLAIHPLVPKSWRNTTTGELEELGLISYSLELTTFYHMEKLGEEAVDDLITIGVSYLLKPGDDTVDASDTLTTTV